MSIEANKIESVQVDFLKDALYTHAKQVRNFCNAGFNRISDYDDKQREKHGDEFISKAFFTLSINIIKSDYSLVCSAR